MPDRPVTLTVFKREGRTNFECQWTDPATGRKRTRSTGHKVKRDAERWAAKLEQELNDGTAAVTRVTWKDFRTRLERDFLPDKRPSTRDRYKTALDSVERHVNPKLLTGVTAEAVGRYKAAMRAAGQADAGVAANLRHLKAVLRWGFRQGLLPRVPVIDIPAGEAPAKGRPLTDGEFAAVLDAVPGVVGEERAASWRHLLTGLWLSGLRLGEAAVLTWDDPGGIRVRLDGAFPAYFIPGRLQKGRRDTVTPVTPDFAAFLTDTPEAGRTGFVFDPAPTRGTNRFDRRRTGIIVSRIGKASGVEVKPGQHPTAHDLRRTFCFRWSQRVLPQQLRVLARHANVATTLQFYAEADAGMTAEAVWSAAERAAGTGGTAADGANSEANTPPSAG